MIATNAGGAQALRHGSMGAQVVGLEAVLANGEIFDWLRPLKKDNRGPDLSRLFIGSEGTLGVVTRAQLRLAETAPTRAVAWVGLSSPDAARELLVRLDRSLGVALEAFEILPRTALASALRYLPDARAPVDARQAWHALIECSGGSETADRLAEALDAAGLPAAALAANETQAEAFWALRDAVSPAEKRRGPAVQHDVSVPVDAMPRFIETACDAVAKQFPGHEGMAFGHLGDGNVHFHVRAPEGVDAADWGTRKAPAISRFVHDLVHEFGGSISAEHGIGQMKRDELERLTDPVRLDVLRAVKRALDPHRLFNPGKLMG